MFRKTDIFLIIGLLLIIVAVMYFGVVYGFSNQTNATLEMKLGDNWQCGYITNTTTLQDIRDCFRD